MFEKRKDTMMELATDRLPLAGYPLFETRDLDAARHAVAQVYCDHRLERLGKGPIHARQNRLQGRRLSINTIRYGAAASIVPGALGSFYLFQFPLRGSADIRCGKAGYRIGGGTSGILNPSDPIEMEWSADCAQLMVQIDRDAMDAAARDHCDMASGAQVTFSGPADLTRGPGLRLAELLRFLVAQAEGARSLIGAEDLVGAQIEQALLLALIEAHPHQFEIALPAAATAPRTMRRAEAFIDAHLGEPITLDEIAAASGIGPRALQEAFRLHRGTSPMQFLRDRRLERADAALRTGDPDVTVTDIAMTWGFFHLGRFSEQYRRRYGCTPVETLRRAL
ncbi:AraC family transcriptional regulator [Roseicyclus sp. F158]|uniref:AraC family transcriptional regulator n=1 Tax=Tropicimonas omnivorans TaxID=3075590 RepID=A0ABU3DC65_9RHOB|nr:AraC family transcriptional regulator [Roseicyclus sp. F158]MDT0681148.1 AraC family transcriptional regulator [Roseicyclus sp. F158]